MLIGFQVANFKSFRDRQTLSMIAGRFPEHAGLNTLETGIKGFDQLLRTAVVYGPNAAGKTNLLRAIEFMKLFVMHSAALAGAPMPFHPFRLAKSYAEKPSEFEISFIQNNIRYEYSFALGPIQILEERLVEYTHTGAKRRGRTLFDRRWDADANRYDWNFSSHLKGQRAAWSESTRPEALFLSTAIQLNSAQLLPVYEWFQKRLIVIVGNTDLNQTLTYQMLDTPNGKEILLPFLRQADLGIADLEIKKEPLPVQGMLVGVGNNPPFVQPGNANAPPAVLTVRLAHESDDPNAPVSFPIDDESAGTVSLFKMAGAWINVLQNGEVLLVDEIDRNMHPSLLRYLLKMFHTPSLNAQNAQLICNTHNTALLDQRLFRRDQVWFVDKERGGSSKLYPLTDFRPRNDEVLEAWYMRGRYGAQPMLPGFDLE